MSAENQYIVPPAKTVMFFGASIGQPYGTAGGAPDPTGISFVNLFRAAWEQKGDTVIDYCYANGPATTLADFIANYSTLVSPYIPARTGRPLLVVFPCCGSIDVFGGTSAAATYALMVTAVGLVHADGGRVLISTVTPGSYWSGSPETNRAALNVLYAANAVVTTPVFDYYWPLAAIFSITTAPYFGADNQHLSNFGHIQGAQQLELAQNGYYRNGDEISVQSSISTLSPITDSESVLKMLTSAKANVLQVGTYSGLPQFAAFYCGPVTPGATNYTLIADGSSTVLNASGSVLFRIGGSTIAKVAGTDLETLTAGSGVIVPAPNGTRYRISVSNIGVVTATAV